MNVRLVKNINFTVLEYPDPELVKNVPAGEDRAWGGLDLTGNHIVRSFAHHILWKTMSMSSLLCSGAFSSMCNFLFLTHLCVYGCSLPHLFGHDSSDDRHKQTQAADSDRCHT